RPSLLIRAFALAECLRRVQGLIFERLKQPLACFVVIVKDRLRLAEPRVAAALAVGLVALAAFLSAPVAKPHDAVAVDLHVEIAVGAGGAFGRVLAFARRDVGDAMVRQYFLRGHGADSASSSASVSSIATASIWSRHSESGLSSNSCSIPWA